MKYRLKLLAEAKIKDLLKDVKVKRYEASGIQYKDDHFYIVLDNMPHPVRISKDLDALSKRCKRKEQSIHIFKLHK